MSGMTGGSMLRTRKKDASIKPNRRLDRKSSRGMLYENEELRLRTININAEVERGQSDIKKLRRENEQLRREVGALRGEYDRLEKLLKSRHQEEFSDPEESGSYCSDCDNDCNCTRSDSSVPHECGREDKFNHSDMSCEQDSTECCVRSCGMLTVVQEEPSQKSSIKSMDPQTSNSQRSVSNYSPITPTDYYKAVVTVPLAPHPSDAVIFPKTGLDVLINNNDIFQNFEGYAVAPPLGFIIPPSINDEYFHNIPNVDLNADNLNFNIDPDKQNDLKIISVQNNLINCGADLNDVKNEYCGDSITSENSDSVNDSFLVCNTRQIIKKITVQNANKLIPKAAVQSNIDLNENLPTSADLPTIGNDDEKQSFRTEKNIELYYDYPKQYVENEANFDNASRINCEEFKNYDLTQSMETTTEIKSTIMLFERKNKANRSRNKPIFGRSQSVPVETLMGEPIYATVKKLPNKFEHLHIRKLENEIKYIPPEENIINSNVNDLAEDSVDDLTNIPKEPDTEFLDDLLEINQPKISIKPDDVNESSETNEERPNINIIPKSPIARKKKRFSIHFKLKGNKKRSAQKLIDDAIKINDDASKPDEPVTVADTPDAGKVKNIDNELAGRKHSQGKIYGINAQMKSKLNCPCRRVHQGDKCLIHRRNSTRECEHNKKRYSPVRNYFKHDSYQEITTSHSERERTNSLSSSGHSGFSLTANKPHKMKHREGSIPWCGCWGNSCL